MTARSKALLVTSGSATGGYIAVGGPDASHVWLVKFIAYHRNDTTPGDDIVAMRVWDAAHIEAPLVYVNESVHPDGVELLNVPLTLDPNMSLLLYSPHAWELYVGGAELTA